MKIVKALWLLGALGATSAGCSTQFWGTAPAAAADKTYVAGSHNNRAAIWLCPKNGGACQRVDVDDE